MRSARPSLRELRALLRTPEAGSYNLEEYVAAHGAELGLDPHEMVGPDEVVGPRLRARLLQHREAEREVVRGRVGEDLRELRLRARWDGEELRLPFVPLCRLTRPTVDAKYIALVGEGIEVTVSRQLLHRATAALSAFRDVSVTLTGAGLHLRWGARGGLNFYPQRVDAHDDKLVVTLPRRPAFRTMPVLLGEVLAEMSFGV